MSDKNLQNSYKLNTARYKHYYQDLLKYANKPPTQVSIALLLTVFTIIFFAVAAIRPTLTTITTLLKEIEEKEVIVEELKKKSAALATAQQVYAQNSQAIQKLDEAIPSFNNPKEFIGYIESIAAASGVSLDSIGVAEYQIPQEEGEDEIDLLGINMRIVAPYQELVPLIDVISKTPRFITIDSIGISNEEEGETDSPQMTLQISLVAINEERL